MPKTKIVQPGSTVCVLDTFLKASLGFIIGFFTAIFTPEMPQKVISPHPEALVRVYGVDGRQLMVLSNVTYSEHGATGKVFTGNAITNVVKGQEVFVPRGSAVLIGAVDPDRILARCDRAMKPTEGC